MRRPARVHFETHIGGIPSVVVATINPEEGDNWNSPYIPAHVDHLQVLNPRGTPCKWRLSRMTDDDYRRIEREALAHEQREREEQYL